MPKLILTLFRDKNNEWNVRIEREGRKNTYPLQVPETTPYWDAIDYMLRIVESTGAAQATFTVE